MLKRGFSLWLFIFSVVYPAVAYNNEGNTIRVLVQSLSGELPDTVRLNRLVRIADFYMSDKNSLKRGEAYAAKALTFAEDKKLPVPYRLRWLHATILRSHDMVKQAEEQMNAVISYLEEKKIFGEAAEARNYLASIIYFSGQFNKSLEVYQSNIAFAREKNLKTIIPKAFEGMAMVYLQSGDTAGYHKHLRLFLESAKAENDPGLSAQACFRLGVAAMATDSNLRNVMPFMMESLKIRQSIHDTLAILTTLNMIGWFYFCKSELDSSLRYYLLSVSYCPTSNITGFAKPYGNIGTIYRDRKEYGKAMYYYDLCEQYCLKTRDFYVLSGLYKDMSDMYITRGDYKKAYEYHAAYKTANDSLNAGRYLEGLAYARTKFDTEAKEKELQVLSLKLEQHKYFVYGIAGLMVLLVVIGFLLYRQSRMAARRKISEMTHRLTEITHANLRQQMNPHFIFNTLNSIQYYMYQHDKIATNNYLTKFSQLIRKILENSQQNLVPLRDELDVIQLYLELETLRFKEKFSFEITVDEEIDTMTCKIPTMLIQPYVENAVCHGLISKPGHGRLVILMELRGQHICCIIEDDGIGREAATEIKKMKDTPHHSLGTRITESRINITNTLYGTDLKVTYTDLKDENGLPCGTRVELQLPIMT